MIVVDSLSDALMVSLSSDAETVEKAQGKFAAALSLYLHLNNEIQGAYVGIVNPPATGPDPLNNTYVWSVAFTPLIADLNNPTSFDDWVSKLNSWLATRSVKVTDKSNKVTTSTQVVGNKSLQIDKETIKSKVDPDANWLDNQKAVYTYIVECIVESLTIDTPINLISSTSSGSGQTSMTISL